MGLVKDDISDNIDYSNVFNGLHINPNIDEEVEVYQDKFDDNKIGNVYNYNLSEIDDPPYTSLAIFFNYCSLKCPTCCMQPLLKGAGSVPFNVKYLEDYVGIIESVTVVGGEPFAQNKENLEKIFKKAKSLNLRVSANTNGLHMWEPEVKKLWKYIDHINIHVTPEFMALGLDERLSELPFDVETTVVWHPHNMAFIIDAMGKLPEESFAIKKDFYFGGNKMVNTKL
jgi:organic radical activating enzyme